LLAGSFKLIYKESASTSKSCPECGYQFHGSGWEGIDAHWKANHEQIMPYEKALPLIKAGTYRKQ
jgi:agmatinase